MKKIFTAFLAIVVICILLALGDVALNQQKTGGGKQTLTIYNWGDYIDPALITKFEHQTGYHVDYETFDSNESMLTKIRQGGTNYGHQPRRGYVALKSVFCSIFFALIKKIFLGNVTFSVFLRLIYLKTIYHSP